jgi:hypothetical protein
MHIYQVLNSQKDFLVIATFSTLSRAEKEIEHIFDSLDKKECEKYGIHLSATSNGFKCIKKSWDYYYIINKHLVIEE